MDKTKIRNLDIRIHKLETARPIVKEIKEGKGGGGLFLWALMVTIWLVILTMAVGSF